MNQIMIDFQQVFEVAEKTARKYFKNNKDIFMANNYDADDLIQEAQSRAFRTIQKYSNGKYGNPDNKNPRPANEIFKLSNKAVSWKLREKLRLCRKKFLKMQQYRITHQSLPLLSSSVCFEDDVDYTKELSAEAIVRENRINALGFRFEQIASILSEDEYDIVTEVIKNGSTFDRLSEKYDRSSTWVKNIYYQSLEKIKHYLSI